MMFIGLAFPVIAFLFLGGVIVYTKKSNNPKKKASKKKADDEYENTEFQKKFNKNSLKKLMNIKEIKNNKVYLRNEAIRVTMGMSSPDFELLTDEEQTTFENCLIMSALSLSSSIMFYTTLKKIEIKEPAEQVEKTMNSNDELISDGMKNYCSQLYVAYKKLEDEKGIYVRKSYCTAGVHMPDKDDNKVLNELQSRVDNLAGGLSRANMKINLLNSIQLAQLYSDIYNHGKNLKLDKMIKEDGIFDLYSEGVGQIVELEKEE